MALSLEVRNFIHLTTACLDWQTICEAVSAVWKGEWDDLSTVRGNGALPAAWYLARNFAGMRLAELGEAAGSVAYPAVSIAIAARRL